MTVAPRPARGRQPLVALMLEVEEARTYVADGRSRTAVPTARDDQHRRNRLLLDALDAYASGAGLLGAPVPYRYRDEQRLLRAVYSGVARSTAHTVVQ